MDKKAAKRGKAALNLASEILTEIEVKGKRRVWSGKERRVANPAEPVLFDRRKTNNPQTRSE